MDLATLGAVIHSRFGLKPHRTVHDIGFRFLTKNVIIRKGKSAPKGLKKWAEINFLIDQVEKSKTIETYFTPDPEKPEDKIIIRDFEKSPVYSPIEIWGSSEYAVQIKYEKTVTWLKFNLDYLQNGIEVDVNTRPCDVLAYKIHQLPNSFDFTENILRTVCKFSFELRGEKNFFI